MPKTVAPKVAGTKPAAKSSLRKKPASRTVGPAGRGGRRPKTTLRPNPLGALLPQTDIEADAGEAPTERQMEIYGFIREKIQSRGFGPTVREIGQAFKIRSPNGVVCHLKALERKGLITRGKNMSRAIELVMEPASLRGLPMAGWVAAGTLRDHRLPIERKAEA